MHQETFQTQLKELGEVYGASNYSAPVARRLWQAFSNCHDDDFIAAVDNLIATQPAKYKPPLFEEISKAVENAKVRRNQNERTGRSMIDVLHDASFKSANPDYAKACVKHIRDKLDGKLTPEQWEQGCYYLEQTGKMLNKQCTEDEQYESGVL